MADPGEFDYWLAGELPETPPDGKDVGEFDYWSAGELPPLFGESGAGATGTSKNVPTLGAG